MNASPSVPARASATDVARLAGVSQKTVSRVMNNEPYVRDEVRERVLRAASQLRYRPNAAARSLTSGRSRRIGLVAMGVNLYGPTSIVPAIERWALSRGYATAVAHTAADEAHSLTGPVDSLLGQGVDGLVLAEDIDEGTLSLTLDLPVVTMGRFEGVTSPRRIRAAEVADDSGYVATRHLIELGHREIRHVCGDRRWWAARDREDGWRTALREAGLPEVPAMEADWTCDGGYAAGQALARHDLTLTAVFVANDEMAIGLMKALADAGRRVPEDISVVGMDDLPVSRYITPPLTSIVLDVDAIAEQAVRLLLSEIDSPTPTGERLRPFPARLAIRESAASPRR